MVSFPFDVLAFDLDGTLADTAPDLAAALNLTLTDLGRPGMDPGEVRPLVGHGAKALIREALALGGEAGEALVEQGYSLYFAHYGANICAGTRCYPGVEQALDDLAALGVNLAICTNKPEGLAHQLVDALGWTGRFAAVVGADTLPFRKPDPRPLNRAVACAGGGRAAFVGDSITDAETAQAAALPFIAVSFGYRDRPVDELGADAVIESWSDVVATLRAL